MPILVFIALIFTFPWYTTAQFSATPDATIELTPSFPGPEETFSVSLNAFTIDTTNATIVWIIDGVETPTIQNSRQFSLTAKSIAEQTTIEAQIRYRDGRVIRTQREIRPVGLDLIINAFTLVPPHYEGRELPSPGSTIQVVAVPNDGTGARPETYSYTWRFNNTIVNGGSVAGGNIGRFTFPALRNNIIEVDVANAQGTVIAQRSISVPSANPQIIVYEDNPLRGLSTIAIPASYQLRAPEVTLRAEPYFMDRSIFTQNPHTEWKVNGKTIQNPSEEVQSITIQRGEGRGRFDIEFHIRNLAQLLQGARSEFSIFF